MNCNGSIYDRRQQIIEVHIMPHSVYMQKDLTEKELIGYIDCYIDLLYQGNEVYLHLSIYMYMYMYQILYGVFMFSTFPTMFAYMYLYRCKIAKDKL